MDRKALVRAYVVEEFLLGNDVDLTSAQSLLETGVLDSTGVVELLSYLEETFGIEIGDQELVPANLDSIDKIVAFLDRKLVTENAETAPTT
jgi:acyl carrier protein